MFHYQTMRSVYAMMRALDGKVDMGQLADTLEEGMTLQDLIKQAYIDTFGDEIEDEDAAFDALAKAEDDRFESRYGE